MREGLKQRLIGAFVLIALGVIFLPGFFNEQGDQAFDTRSRIPPQPRIETVEFALPEADLAVEPAPEPETMFLPSDTPSAAPVAAEPAPTAVPTSTPAPQAQSLPGVPELTLDDKGLPQAWLIQVASLGNYEAAVRLRDQLQAEGYRAFLRETVTDTGRFNRVLIGPKADRAEAESIKRKIDAQFKVNAQIRRFEP